MLDAKRSREQKERTERYARQQAEVDRAARQATPATPTEEEDEYADLFRDHFKKVDSIYQDEDPSEARRVLREAKECGDWLSDDDYLALQDAVAAGKDDGYFEQIRYLSPKETLRWFNAKMKRGVKMSSNVWEEVAEKVAPMQEAELLAELAQVPPGRVRAWLSRKKSEGYFFTEYAYEQAFKKHLQRRKPKK
jgi:hypothetical protein